MLTWLGRWGRRRAETDPWTNVYGFARSAMAVSGALTLAVNRPDTLFRAIAGTAARPPFCADAVQKMGFFCVTAGVPSLARWLGVAILLLVASGWRPRVTGLLHWWVVFSFQLSASTLEGGDQAAADLTLLLLPVTLTDGRRWHWSAIAPRSSPGDWELVRRLVALSGMLMVRLQVSAIYFHAAMGKMRVTEWADGTALYYWLSHPVFGVSPAMRPAMLAVTSNGVLVSLLTWGTMVLELFLCMGLVATRSVQRVLLWGGMALHLGILVFMGLFTFSVTMCAALVLYLRPWSEPFQLEQAIGRLTAVFASLRLRLDGGGREIARQNAASAPATSGTPAAAEHLS